MGLYASFVFINRQSSYWADPAETFCYKITNDGTQYGICDTSGHFGFNVTTPSASVDIASVATGEPSIRASAITGQTAKVLSICDEHGAEVAGCDKTGIYSGDGSGLMNVSATSIQTNTPLSSSPGTAGQIAYDNTYLYVCTSTNVWKRVAFTVY
jgi:hypothetical protein